MKEAAIFMLCQLAGKEPTGANFKKIAEAAGVELDEDAAKALIADMKEKNLEEVLAAGAEKMKDMGAGGGGGGGGGGDRTALSGSHSSTLRAKP